jgi:hypothetical protein
MGKDTKNGKKMRFFSSITTPSGEPVVVVPADIKKSFVVVSIMVSGDNGTSFEIYMQEGGVLEPVPENQVDDPSVMTRGMIGHTDQIFRGSATVPKNHAIMALSKGQVDVNITGYYK